MNISPSGVVMGAMPPLMPCGKSVAMLPRRSPTCWRAQKMSVPSWKSTVTSTRPYLETERSIRWFGMPSISTSMGTAMRLSISSGVMPGAFMMILTWVLETSGNASIGRLVKAYQPAPASSAPASSTKRRCASAN